jgi:peroxiredoxin
MRHHATSTLGLLGLSILPGLLLAASFGSALTHADSSKTASSGKTVKPFTLNDSAGKPWSLAGQKDSKAIVVVFLGTECPVNNQYLPRLGELHKNFSAKGVSFVGVNSNALDTPTRIAAHAKANAIPFPVLKDSGNVVADDFAAQRTPEAFVLSPAGKILYQGRIDNQYGIGFKRKEPTSRDLAAALDAILAGKEVPVARTEAPGCLIARARTPKEKGSITWAKQVSRIVQDRCQECHRPGQVGPMPLLRYEDALSWSETIREVVQEKRMPPWHANSKHGTFSNDRSLAKQERDTLLAWIDEGCPKGDQADLPAPKKWSEGWTIGKPDAVFHLPNEVTVPAKAGARGIAYRYYQVKTSYEEDRWVQAAEARPGAREVVHHIIVQVWDGSAFRKRLTGGRDERSSDDARDGIGARMLVAYAPGDMPLVLKPGQAKKLPKGAVLVFQMHYTPDGIERKDRSSVGLVFAKEPPKHEIRTGVVAQRTLLIPPGANNYTAQSKRTFDRDAELFSFMPHMHLRGKDFTYVAVFPDGRKETLLSVPRYDFNWQSSYRLKTPLRLPAGTRIECTAHFDNSADNPNNPDPNKRVMWGDQTWEEMMIGFVDYAFVDGAKSK